MPASTSKSKLVDQLAVIGFAVFALVGLIVWLQSGGSQPSQKPTAEPQKHYLKNDKGGQVGVAVSKEASERASQFASAGDEVGLNDLIRLGLIFFVNGNTEVRLIDFGFSRCEVRILEGPHQGKLVWVVTDHLQRE